MRKFNRNRNRKGQGLVEYALIIAGVALIGIVGITMFGHKVADLIGTVAVILPGAHTDDNGPITAGHLIETTIGANGAISVDVNTIAADTDSDRLNGQLLGGASNVDSGLVTETSTPQ
jgi:pilus assembly protein Flp/PilA